MASEAQSAAVRSEPAGRRPASCIGADAGPEETAGADTATRGAGAAVVAAGQAALVGAGPLRRVPADELDTALLAIAARLRQRAASVLAANQDDVRAARADGLADAFVDRLALDESRIEGICDQLDALAGVPAEPASR